MNGDMSGRLFLMPNTLDLGTVPDVHDLAPLTDVLPLHAIQVAAGLRHWVAENAKSARLLLKRVDGVVPLGCALQGIDIRELPRPPKGGAAPARPTDWGALLAPARKGQDIGLVSEAGLPGVADPGAEVVAAAHAATIPVIALAGPSSLTLALAASGLHGQSFAFSGYLPAAEPERGVRIRELEGLSRRWRQTQIVIETPYRNQAVFEALLAALAPATRLSVNAGLTLQGGTSRTASVADWRRHAITLADRLPAVFCFLA